MDTLNHDLKYFVDCSFIVHTICMPGVDLWGSITNVHLNVFLKGFIFLMPFFFINLSIIRFVKRVQKKHWFIVIKWRYNVPRITCLVP